METYAQMKKRHQDEVNALPLMFAFSNDQFDEGCRKLGVTDPKSELYALGGTGGFYRRSDDELVSGTFLRHKVEFAKAMKDSDFAIGAFSYEIARCQVPHLNRNDGGQRERHHAEFLGSAHQSSPTANLRKTIQIKIVKKT